MQIFFDLSQTKIEMQIFFNSSQTKTDYAEWLIYHLFFTKTWITLIQLFLKFNYKILSSLPKKEQNSLQKSIEISLKNWTKFR